MASRATVPDAAATSAGGIDSNDHSPSDRGRGRDRARDRNERRDNRPVPDDIKPKSLPLLALIDPLRPYGRWFSSL